MAIRNDILLGSDYTYNEIVYSDDLNDTFNATGSYLKGKQLGCLDSITAALPIGTILPWLKSLTGTPQTLPTGWQECDGTNSTPNLNGSTDATKIFLRGTSGTTGSTGGYSAHAHGVNTNRRDYADGTLNAVFSVCSSNTALPKRYDVVFIMRIS